MLKSTKLINIVVLLTYNYENKNGNRRYKNRNKKKIRFPINFTIDDLNFGFRVVNDEKFNKSKVIDLRIPNKVITYD